MENIYLTNLLDELQTLAERFEHTFGSLTEDQLNWKPNPKQWSIAQCIDHMILANKAYFPTLVQIGNGTKKSKKREKLPVISDVWGAWLVRSSRPNSRLNKLRAPETYLPSEERIGKHIIQEFLDHQLVLRELLEKTDRVPHESTVITSPRNGLVTFNLKDCCKIILHHEISHMKQANEVLKHSLFPLGIQEF
ncbi:MAG: DinB family protein [Bacteroidota bacterium]